jgi:hypothetical protein
VTSEHPHGSVPGSVNVGVVSKAISRQARTTSPVDLSGRFYPHFRDQNRRGIGKSQSMWTDSKMETPGSHEELGELDVAVLRGFMQGRPANERVPESQRWLQGVSTACAHTVPTEPSACAATTNTVHAERDDSRCGEGTQRSSADHRPRPPPSRDDGPIAALRRAASVDPSSSKAVRVPSPSTLSPPRNEAQ